MLAQVVVKLVKSDGVRIDRRRAHLYLTYRDMRFQLLEEAVDILDVACVPAG
jgi:NADH:ubiquinone oxidoreductase subunit D